ncbi:hypothetical protein BDN70DRAFT_528631 [Pholiota conissans]|uniref:Uncharacterized protein n=1 Tax=Pholiota conissans TaxID=109636 RepID=A0A9P6D2V3_9AGAR|nr:hypothetical protein BDN70DRAFT_528631 [Pholiota conissans]
MPGAGAEAALCPDRGQILEVPPRAARLAVSISIALNSRPRFLSEDITVSYPVPCLSSRTFLPCEVQSTAYFPVPVDPPLFRMNIHVVSILAPENAYDLKHPRFVHLLVPDSSFACCLSHCCRYRQQTRSFKSETATALVDCCRPFSPYIKNQRVISRFGALNSLIRIPYVEVTFKDPHPNIIPARLCAPT